MSEHSDEKVVDLVEGNGEEQEGEEGTGHKADRRTFSSAAEARAAGPVGKTQRLFAVTADGLTTFVYARHTAQAWMVVCEARGWKAVRVTDDKAKVAALLEQLSDEDRAILIARYVPAPEPTSGKGRGKK